MRARALPLAVLLVLGAGCQRCDGPEAATQARPDDVAGAERAEGAGPSPAPASRTPAPAGVRVVAEPGRFREVGIVVRAHGPEPVRLGRAVTVERARGDSFERVEATGITLRPDCATEAPECIELAPGAELLPPPWSGSLGAAQCGCEGDACRPAPAGRYRFVVTSCDGAHRVEGEPFALGD